MVKALFCINIYYVHTHRLAVGIFYQGSKYCKDTSVFPVGCKRKKKQFSKPT